MPNRYLLDLNNLQNLTGLIRPENELARVMQQAAHVALKSMSESFHLSLTQMNKSFAKALDFSVLAKPPFPYFLPDVTRFPVSETEAIPISDTPTHIRGMFGLSVVNGNSVKYKNKMLKGISTNNRVGRFIIYLILKRSPFITDEELSSKFYIHDAQSFYWLKRDLQSKFNENGLKVYIERRFNPNGYMLLDVEYFN